jgi:isoquinoline 1-oxidoreductase subunit beta
MKSPAKILDAEFSMPFLSHACMEPVSCTARIGDQVELWLSTKSPSLDAGHAARVLGIDPSSIVVHNEYQGGDFGRRSGMEHTTEAVLLARATGRARESRLDILGFFWSLSCSAPRWRVAPASSRRWRSV